MNEVINLLKNHRSIRKFKDQPLCREQVETIVSAAQSASTSSFIQAYSIIGISDENKKKQLAELAGGQSYVEENGYFLIFCADYHRHSLAGGIEGVNIDRNLESMETFMIALIDTSLAAQNAAIAAESMNLGICYIGGIRNNIEKVSELLNLPDRVIPLFGMAIGYPEADSALKPRLPLKAVFHENEYEDKQTELEAYNEIISAYYAERTNGTRQDRWTEQVIGMLTSKQREFMMDFIKSKHFALK